MVNIPQSVFDLYNKTNDDFINLNFGVNCKLFYPALQIECPNCVVDVIGNKSSNIYKPGGPVQFSDGMICPFCNGEGYKEEYPEETIKMRIYWTKKEWVKTAANIAIPDGSIQVIGFLSDLPKVQKSIFCHINTDIAQINNYKYVKSSEFFPWGFKKNRYFIGFLQRN